MMDICHPHNQRVGLRDGPRPFGLRLSLPTGDPMRNLLGDDWHTYEWFETEADRERRMTELAGQFVYYRKGDRPTYVVERVNRDMPADAG
jgi:hypothetical protein